MLWKSYLPWFGTFLLLVFVSSQEGINSLMNPGTMLQPRAAPVPVRAGGEALAELEIGPHGNPSSLLKIFSRDALRARTPLSPAITLELKGMRLLLRSNSGATVQKVGS